MSIGKSGIIPNNLGFIVSDLLYISKYNVETVQTPFNEKKNKY